MTEFNGRANGSGPSEPSDTPANWRPSHERPWRPAGPDSVLYVHDEGQPWCGDRQFHPQFQNDDYPNPDHHWTECRSYGGAWPGWFEDAKAGLNGPARLPQRLPRQPFLFGRPRYAVAALAELDVRLALEFYPQETGTVDPFRCSIPAGSIRNLVAHFS